jgi:hypothetical protein
MALAANELFPKHNENEHQAVRPLSHDEMEFVSGGLLPVPPIHGGPVPTPTLPAFPVPVV